MQTGYYRSENNRNVYLHKGLVNSLAQGAVEEELHAELIILYTDTAQESIAQLNQKNP